MFMRIGPVELHVASRFYRCLSRISRIYNLLIIGLAAMVLHIVEASVATMPVLQPILLVFHLW